MFEGDEPQQDAPASDADGDDFSAGFGEQAASEQREDEEAPADSSGSEEPAKAGSDAPASAAAETEPSGEAPAFDPWQGLTPEQTAHFKRLDASDKSQRGRVAALTRKTQQLEQAAKAPPPKQEATESDEAADTAADVDEEYRKAMEDYPEVVGPVVKRFEAIVADLQSKVDALPASQTPQDSVDADAEEMTKALETLSESHPDFREIGQDPAYHEWLAKQSPKVKGFAESYDPEEVSLHLTMFKAERSLAAARKGDEEQGEQESTATGDKRKRQIEGSRQVSSRGQPAAGGVPNDFGSAFDSRAKAKAGAAT